MTTENPIEQSFVRWCSKRCIPCFKLYKAERGWPDRSVLLPNNVVLWMEFKTKTGDLSPQQKLMHKVIRDAGHTVIVPRSIDEATKAVLDVIESQDRLTS